MCTCKISSLSIKFDYIVGFGRMFGSLCFPVLSVADHSHQVRCLVYNIALMPYNYIGVGNGVYQEPMKRNHYTECELTHTYIPTNRHTDNAHLVI